MDSNILEKYSPVLRKYWLPLVLGVFGLIFLVYGMSGFSGNKGGDEDILFEASTHSATESANKRKLFVDVEGAVFRPGVYELVEGSRIQDALIAAGGMSAEADREMVSKKLNLASKVVDGGKIYVPSLAEASAGEPVFGAGGTAEVAGIEVGGLVDINSASESELDGLSGVGPVTAKKIIDGRPYQTVEELVSKKIVGEKVFGNIKDRLIAQ